MINKGKYLKTLER